MKKIPVTLLVCLALSLAGLAEAAGPKRPPKNNQNRIGPYAVGSLGMTSYTGDHDFTEELVEGLMTRGNPSQNVSSSTDDSDIGFDATFGYRFHRFFAVEFSLSKYGEMVTTASGDVDYPELTGGLLPAKSELAFSSNGVLISGVGILPIKDKIELFGRLGYMFASIEQEFSLKVQGETQLAGSFREDTQEVVYGVGLAWILNPGYAIRAEYQLIDGLGDDSGEKLNFLSLGLQVRF